QQAFSQFWADIAKTAEPASSTERLEFARVAVLIAAPSQPSPSVGGGQGGGPPFDNAAKAKLRQQALDWLQTALNRTADRAGKAQLIAAAAPLPDLLEKLAKSVPNDGSFQAELARHHAEQGNNPSANAARTR